MLKFNGMKKLVLFIFLTSTIQCMALDQITAAVEGLDHTIQTILPDLLNNATEYGDSILDSGNIARIAGVAGASFFGVGTLIFLPAKFLWNKALESCRKKRKKKFQHGTTEEILELGGTAKGSKKTNPNYEFL